MPALNWDTFKGLPGSSEKNFEQLCRGLVRLNFGRYGTFHALSNQPGVEFHLRLDKRCDALGDPGRWWGWQCKWYVLAANGELGATRRAKIEEGLRKTEKYLPELTDWVLWTRQTLTKNDQTWFNRLSSKMNLHLWAADEVDNNLVGQAAVLRGTYFGDLVLTSDILRELHAQSVAPIRTRWQPDVHHLGDAERDLRRMLGEAEAWNTLCDLAVELRASATAVESSPTVPAPLAPFVTSVVVTAKQTADTLDRVARGVNDGDLDLLRDELIARPRALTADVATAPRRLRAGNHRAGLYATNAVAGCQDAIEILAKVEDAYSSRLVAVLAPAGCGKTHLAAQLTSGTTARPPGVLLHGRNLHASHTLNDLARGVAVAAQPLPSMEALLAAIDAAGQRAQKRLPIVIDGLNESEDPRTWKPLLAQLEATLAKYPYVLVICMLRPEFEAESLPEGTRLVKMKDYGNTTREAVLAHFRHWKIDATDTYIPSFLSHPLTLRLFCEVTNPTRRELVGVGAMPSSLTALFERYLEQVGMRVVELSPRTQRFFAQDVSTAIMVIAKKLWESRERSIEMAELRTLLGDAQRPWDQSIVRALEHEGVLLRMPSRDGDNTLVPVYDMLGGHIIATALLAQHGLSSFETWSKKSSTLTSLAGKHNARHPLADDVLRSLVGQVPRRFHAKQLWQMVDEPLCGRALRMTAQLEPASLDAATVDALLELVQTGDSELLNRLWKLRGVLDHPLNAEGLDRALRPMEVSVRDLRWTEWLRQNHSHLMGRGTSVLRDLQNLKDRWRARTVRGGDRLRARWVMWTLTSTVRQLRDQATCALYWFGRIDPKELFALTIDSLTVNDAYVGERMLAASYGVVVSHHKADAEISAHLRPFLEQLSATLVGSLATAPSQHYLARNYVRGIVAFTAKFYPASLPTSLVGSWTFAAPQPVLSLSDGDAQAKEVRQAMRMDFENYTLGRLFNDRSPYDMSHAGHKAAVAYVQGVVWAHGWRPETLGTIDKRVAEDAFWLSRGNRPLIERYGKKYGWIGFYKYAGCLEDSGQFPLADREFTAFDIDPTFPDEAPSEGHSSVPEEWLASAVDSHESWVRTSPTSLPLSVIRRETIGEHPGPWIAVHGHLSSGDRVLGRYAWSSVSAIVVAKRQETPLVTALKAGTRPWRAHDAPSDHYIFAGEIPWHTRFAKVEFSAGGYREKIPADKQNIEIETLAHSYAWESRHSEINRAGSALVPSKVFSERFDLRSVAQSFDQVLPDGSRASITLAGVDGLEGDILYLHQDLLQQYVDDRSIVWLVFGERELRPFPSPTPQWMEDALRERASEWSMVLTEADVSSETARTNGINVSASAKAPERSAGRTNAKAPKASKKPTKSRSPNLKQAGRGTP